MGRLQGANRCEAIPFPERLDNYLAAEQPVRFIDAFSRRCRKVFKRLPLTGTRYEKRGYEIWILA